MPFRTLFLLLMCLGLAGLSAAACGGDDSESIDSANQTAAAQDDEDNETEDEANDETPDDNGATPDDQDESPDDGGENGGGSASVFDLREGHCFNADAESAVGEIELVDCAEAHQYEVVNIFNVPDADAFPGDEYFGDQAVENCDTGSVTYLAPSAGTWDVGDRVVICLAEGTS